MKAFFILLFLLIGADVSFAQKSITIDVENLKKPAEKLSVTPYKKILEDMIRMDRNVPGDPFGKKSIEPSFNIIAKNDEPEKLVNFGLHSFFEGMYNAYAQHRPFTLSPDMIWLLICQGFSNHVNNNSESLRSLLVDFTGKTTLIVNDNSITLDNPNSPWQEVFPKFSKQISDYTGKELTGTLTANFSTTTAATKMASQITLMSAVKSYFDFIVIRLGCGIPKITLEGSTEDWQRVLNKTEALRKFKLDWWIDEMEPVLKNIIAASKGETNKKFWQKMFKYHSQGKCGSPTMVDGWIVKFFPYNNEGKRNNLDSISVKGTLPNEMVKVDLQYEEGNGSGKFVTTPLELWAGFIGLKQNDTNFTLTPEIGWMIRKKDAGANEALKSKFKDEAASTNWYSGIMIRVKTIPPELMEIGPINSLEVDFTDKVEIPDEMAGVKIARFRISGEINGAGIARVKKLLPHTALIINGKEITHEQGINDIMKGNR